MLSSTFRLWLALILRDIRTRRGPSRLTFLLALIEPLGQLAVVYIVFRALGRRSDYGPSLFLFLMTGVLPYFLFTHIVSRIMSAIRVAYPLQPLGVVTVVDVAIAQLVVETLTVMIIGMALFYAAIELDIPGAVPQDPIQLGISTGVMALTAFGVGLFNAAVALHFTFYRMIWTLIARSLIFFSNVFFVADFLPAYVRDWLWWNPLLHGVIWFRTGVYQFYPHLTLSYAYALYWCLGAVLIGLAAQRVLHRQI